MENVGDLMALFGHFTTFHEIGSYEEQFNWMYEWKDSCLSFGVGENVISASLWASNALNKTFSIRYHTWHKFRFDGWILVIISFNQKQFLFFFFNLI